MKTYPLLLNDRDIELIRDVIAFYVFTVDKEDYVDYEDAKERGFKEGLLEVLLEKLPKITKEKNGLEK